MRAVPASWRARQSGGRVLVLSRDHRDEPVWTLKADGSASHPTSVDIDMDEVRRWEWDALALQPGSCPQAVGYAGRISRLKCGSKWGASLARLISTSGSWFPDE